MAGLLVAAMIMVTIGGTASAALPTFLIRPRRVSTVSLAVSGRSLSDMWYPTDSAGPLRREIFLTTRTLLVTR